MVRHLSLFCLSPGGLDNSSKKLLSLSLFSYLSMSLLSLLLVDGQKMHDLKASFFFLFFFTPLARGEKKIQAKSGASRLACHSLKPITASFDEHEVASI